MLQNIICEGLDRLGKSTLLDGIEHRLGGFVRLHFGKPPVLQYYDHTGEASKAQKSYQQNSFKQMFDVLESDARIMLDRAHIGEAVYAKRYRGYSGEYVFNIESPSLRSKALSNTLLVLLVNFDQALEKKLVDDGDSFDWSKRGEEQDDFITAFNTSKFRNKIILPVGQNGEFVSRNKLVEAVVQKFISS